MFLKRIIISLVLSVSLLLTINAVAEDRLIFAIDLIRHGDRNPVKDIPAIHHTWPEGLGELTALGIEQEKKLGSKKRDTYITQAHLLLGRYEPGSIVVFSDDFNRVKMSAQAFLSGLYPNQPIPVTVQNNLFKFDPIEKEKLFNKWIYPNDYWKIKTTQLQDKFPEWNQLVGYSEEDSIKSLNDLSLLGDSLYICQLKKIPLPVRMSKDDIHSIISNGIWTFITEYKSQQVGAVGGRALLKEIFKNILEASDKHALNEKYIKKYVLFFGHDRNILSVLSALKSPVSEAPHYASDLNFALLVESETHQYNVKITFNNPGMVSIHIPECNNSNICSLAQFKQLVDQIDFAVDKAY